MGVNEEDFDFMHGINGAAEILNASITTNNRDQIRYMHGFQWAAAMNSQYMLVLAKASVPWLFDREHDADESFNLLANKNGTRNSNHYAIPAVEDEILDNLYDGIYHAMIDYKFPIMENSFIHYDYPDCMDNPDQLRFWKKMTCVKLSQRRFKHKCDQRKFQEACPLKCGMCCKDSKGFMLIKKKRLSCEDIKRRSRARYCEDKKVQRFCPSTCKNTQCAIIGAKTSEDINRDIFFEESHHMIEQSGPSSYDGPLYYGYE